jgi:hypothetical protein
MPPTNHRRNLLDTSGTFVKYLFTGISSFGIVVVLLGSFGYMDSAWFLITTCTPFLFKGFVSIGCVGFMAVLVESFS